MSWIVRMAASYLMNKSATATNSAEVEHPPKRSADASSGRRPAGLVCWSPEMMARVTDRMTGERDVTGDGFRLSLGQLNGETTIAIRAETTPPGAKHIRALWAGHRPRLAVLLGIATSDQVTIGDLVLASAVTDGVGGQLTLDARSPALPGLHVGVVSGEREESQTLAHCPGLSTLLRECRELEIPTLVVLRVVAAEELRPAENSRTFARQTGRWIGKITKRQGGVSRWWKEHTAENNAIERQIDLAMQFILA